MSESKVITVICGKCGRQLRTHTVFVGTKASSSSSCSCPTCRRTVRYSYNGYSPNIVIAN